MLKSLRKLTLAHNLIEKIENLDQLTGLNELDLSFNKIEKIENLDALVNIEVLTLFHNKIRKLENMETLENLLVFSIGDNLIEDYKEVGTVSTSEELQIIFLYPQKITYIINFFLYISISFFYLPVKVRFKQTDMGHANCIF